MKNKILKIIIFMIIIILSNLFSIVIFNTFFNQMFSFKEQDFVQIDEYIYLCESEVENFRIKKDLKDNNLDFEKCHICNPKIKLNNECLSLFYTIYKNDKKQIELCYLFDKCGKVINTSILHYSD